MLDGIFPELLSEVTWDIAPVPETLDGATACGVLWQAAAGRFLLDVPHVARYLVEGGRHVTLAPAPGAGDADVARFFKRTSLAALLYQRGTLAFHAAAVAGPEGAVLLAGDSGVGKSALLACLIGQGGWKMLADDLSIVALNPEGVPTVWPTSPEMILWSDTRERLNLPSPDTDGRHTLRCTDTFETAPQPLRRIYWLSVHNEKSVELVELQGVDHFRAVSLLSYNSHIADALLDRAAYFQQVAVLSRHISIRRLRRPRRHWTVEELAARIGEEEQ